MRFTIGSLVLGGVMLLGACDATSDGGGASAGAAGITGAAGQAAGGQTGTGGQSAGGQGPQAGSGPAGSGQAGSGQAGSGQAGSGQAGSGMAGSGQAGAGNASDPGQYCVDKINEYRQTLGLPPYARWDDAEGCSDGEAKSDSETKQAHGAFGMCGEFAQDECPGWPGPPVSLLDGCLAQMWAEGPGDSFAEHGHYLNMSSTKYSKVACGFYQTPQGDFWAVQNFK